MASENAIKGTLTILLLLHVGGLEIYIYIYIIWRNNPQWAMASSFLRFLDHTLRRTTVGWAPLDE